MTDTHTPMHNQPPKHTLAVSMIDGDNSGNALTGTDGGQSLAIDPGGGGAGVWATGGDDSLIRYCCSTGVT